MKLLDNIFGITELKTELATVKEKLAQQTLTKRQYNMAKLSRLSNDWLTTAKSFNYDIAQGGAKLIARARELEQNDPYAKKILRLVEKNVVGPKGFLFRNKSGEYVKDTASGEFRFIYDKLANLKIEEAWWEWNLKKYCSVNQRASFKRLCKQAVRSTWRDGEIFFKKIRGNVNKYGYALQPIDPIYCDHSLSQDLGNNRFIIMGVEVDETRKPIAYWFRKQNARNEALIGYINYGDYERITADQIIHLFIEELPGQLRGVTQFAPAGIRMKMLYGFEESALMRSRFSARVPGVISKQPNSMTLSGPGIDATEKDAEGDWVVDLEEGEFLKVKDGYDLKAMDSDYPHPLHKEATKLGLRGIAAGNDVGYSSISGDYESVTWHSGKLEKMDERDGYSDIQQWFIEDFLNVVAYDFLEMGMLSGAINLPITKIEKFYVPVFLGRGWDYTNPKEEIQADIEGLAAGIKTMEEVLSRRGIDMDEHFDQLAREAEKREEYKEKYGVEFIWTKPTAAPKESAPEDDVEDEVEDDEEEDTMEETKPTNGKAHKKLVEELYE